MHGYYHNVSDIEIVNLARDLASYLNINHPPIVRVKEESQSIVSQARPSHPILVLDVLHHQYAGERCMRNRSYRVWERDYKPVYSKSQMYVKM